MAKAQRFDAEGKLLDEVELDARVFEAKILEQAVYESVLRQLANRRTAGAKTKTRSEVRGGGRKPWRQKGTGRARVGSIRSPLWRGGGIAMGPDGTQNYNMGMPKKARRGALRSILTDRARKGRVMLWQAPEIVWSDDLVKHQPRTKTVVELLRNMELEGTKVLFVMDRRAPQFERSANNVPKIKTLLAGNINPHDLLNFDSIVFFENAISGVVEVLA